MTKTSEARPIPPERNAQAAAMGILWALSLSHLLNDALQALIPAVYPLIKESYGLTFAQIGMITFVFQTAGSVFQPLVGLYTDRNPQPYSLVAGMCLSLGGLVFVALANSYGFILAAAGLVGLGSAIFHPESTRMARLASGGRHGFAQSLFQVGGNAGSALGPLLAAWIIVPYGQRSILVFSVLAVTAIFLLRRVGSWYAAHLSETARAKRSPASQAKPHPRRTVGIALAVLMLLMFSKFFYLVSFTNYFTFFLINKFQVTVQQSQYYLFLFLMATVAGTLVGGPVGDRIGRRKVIWISILGMAPFSLLLPHTNLFWTAALSAVVAFIMASAFPAILVFATELLPGNVGLIAGLFFGLAFGMAGIAAAVLGKLADITSIAHVIWLCGFLPLLGLFTVFLPDLRNDRA